MSNRPVLQYPDPKLRRKASLVDFEQDDVEQIVRDLIDTLEVQSGAGLAATQIDCTKRAVVIDPSAFDAENPDPLPGREKFWALINPSFTLSKETEKWTEACLSVAGFKGTVERSRTCELKYWTFDGVEKSLTVDWPLSGALQHECDHLDGVLYIDRLSSFSRHSIVKKIKKRARIAKQEAERAREEEILDLYGPAALREHRKQKKAGTLKKRKPRVKVKKNFGKTKKKRK